MRGKRHSFWATEDNCTLKLTHLNNSQVVKELQDCQKKTHLHNSLKSNIVAYSPFSFCSPLTVQTWKGLWTKTDRVRSNSSVRRWLSCGLAFLNLSDGLLYFLSLPLSPAISHLSRCWYPTDPSLNMINNLFQPEQRTDGQSNYKSVQKGLNFSIVFCMPN